MKLAGYRKFREINRGAITTAWQGERIADKKPVLIKVFNPQWQDQPDLLSRFQREAEISAGLKHENIIEVLDVVEEEDSLAIIFPFIIGQSLAALMDANDKLPFQTVSYITRELLKSLEYAHSSGIVHRDIKPANIMISRGGDVLLTDFGLAKASAMQAISMHGEVVGTPAYMSPEQARSGAVGPQSDMFSLAATLYEALTGIAPFAGETIVESIEKLVSHKPAPLHTLRDDVPRWFSEMLAEMLRKNASERPAAIVDLLALPEWVVPVSAATTLGKMVKEPEKKSLNVAEGKPKRKIPVFGLPHLLAIFLAVTLVFAWQMSNDSPENLTAAAPELDSVIADSKDSPYRNEKSFADSIDTEKHATESPAHPEVPRQLTKQQDLQENLMNEVDTAGTPVLVNKADTILSSAGESTGSAGLFLKIKPWGDIYIDGARRETSPLFRPIKLSEGRYKLEVRNPEYAVFRSDILLTAGKTDTMEVILQSAEGYLDVQVVPWAQIYINEEYRETTPLIKPLSLPVGTHTLRLLNPAYRSWEGKIDIQPNKTTQKKVSLLRD